MAVEVKDMKVPLLYILHSSKLYGTERMALTTATSLVDEYDPVFFAPPGPALDEARNMGFATEHFSDKFDFAWKLRPYISRNNQLAFVATGVSHSLTCLAWNRIYRRKIAHLQVVHGGSDEQSSYGMKRKLNGLQVTLVAVSKFVRDRLIAHGVQGNQIEVVENFLPDAQIASAPKRSRFERPGVRKVVIISRLDHLKRVDLLLDALDREASLQSMSFTIFGSGGEGDRLRARAAVRNPNVTFAGFQPEVAGELASADLLVHTCPEEPFGLAIIEAMAANVPVLVPDSGGAGSLVEEGVSGFRFAANSSDSLAGRLVSLINTPANVLNEIAAQARQVVVTRFSSSVRANDYRLLLHGGKL